MGLINDPNAVIEGSIKYRGRELVGLRPAEMRKLRGREIARFVPPVLSDNFEGLATRKTPEGTEIWILSDDNFFPLQQTLLLKFNWKG